MRQSTQIDPSATQNLALADRVVPTLRRMSGMQ